MNTYEIGNFIKGTVSGIEDYGIFMNLDNDYIGLIHISEVSDGFVKNINNYVKVGDEIYCKVIGIDEEEKKLKLSIKNINYKVDNELNYFETVRGFSVLKDNLDNWIEDKIIEIKEEEK